MLFLDAIVFSRINELRSQILHLDQTCCIELIFIYIGLNNSESRLTNRKKKTYCLDEEFQCGHFTILPRDYDDIIISNYLLWYI